MALSRRNASNHHHSLKKKSWELSQNENFPDILKPFEEYPNESMTNDKNKNTEQRLHKPLWGFWGGAGGGGGERERMCLGFKIMLSYRCFTVVYRTPLYEPGQTTKSGLRA